MPDVPTQVRYAFSATMFALASVVVVRQYEARQAAMSAPIPKIALHPAAAPDAGRPPRSPANDPSMSAHGPRVGSVVNVRGTTYRTVYGDSIVTSEDLPGVGSVAYLTRLAAPAEPQELFRLVGGRLTYMMCNPEKYSPLCVLQEERFKSGDAGSTRTVFTVFDRQTKKLTPVEGPWGDHPGLAASIPLSFNGRFIALVESRAVEGGEDEVLHFVETGAKVRYLRSVDIGSDDEEIVAYEGGSVETPRVIVRIGALGAEGRYESIDMRRGTRARVDHPALASEELATNGPLRFVCREHAGIDVEEIATKKVRSFEVHPDDRARLGEGCGQWLDDRYIELALDGIVWLDTKTMKYSFVSPPDEDGWESLGDEWALRTHDGALWLAAIIHPPD